MLRRIVFIDDDTTELEAFRSMVANDYDCIAVHWPSESAKLLNRPATNVFVRALRLSPPCGDTTPTGSDRDAAAQAAKQVGEQFSKLSTDPSRDDETHL